MLSSLLELARQVRVADVVDVLIVTSLVSAGLAFLRRTHAAFVAAGLLGLAVLYVVASAFDMQLTATILGAFFVFAVVIVVVIFQNELRQLFESIALLGRSPFADAGVQTAHPTEMLVQTLTECARRRVGVLIVLPGRQPVERHLHGGIELDARLSVPLMLSIFDPHSPGHDGAAIVAGTRVRRFAAHLPLSKDSAQLDGMGTRHSAALGLAEVTDACCLVVSEERGEISIASNGRLLRAIDPPRVAAVIGDQLAAQDGGAAARRGWARAWRRGWGERLAVLLVVIGLWLVIVPGGRPAERTVRVPVEIENLPAEWTLASVAPPAIDVTLAGTRRSFYLLAPERLTVEVDASLASLGRRTFVVDERNVRFVPDPLTVVDVDPEQVRLDLTRSETERPAR